MKTNLISIEEAARLMAVPVLWVQGMLKKNELVVQETAIGIAIDENDIRRKGWAVCEQQGLTFSHVSKMLISSGVRA